MAESSKNEQLQIRVSPEQKRAIAHAARAAGLDMSSYVLERVLGARDARTAGLMRELADERRRPYALAELHDLLASLGADALRRAVAAPPPTRLPPEVENYVAAMVEYACGQRGVEVPGWTGEIAPLQTPFFGSPLKNLRLYLLTHSPAPFRRRNLFIDTSIGGRV